MSTPFISIVVCVEYDDFLRLTLPWNAQRFKQTFVITSPDDKATLEVVAHVPKAYPFRTRAFWEDGAHFNKGRAIDDLLEVLADWNIWTDWCCHWDADILLPKNFLHQLAEPLETDCLYVPRCRRICEDESGSAEQKDWTQWAPIPQRSAFDAGWFQLFHRRSSPMATRPFYPRDWGHAGSSDTFFNEKWAEQKRKQLPFDVLHFGTPRTNWHGRHTPRLDGTTPENAQQRRDWMTEMDRIRRRNNTLNYERTTNDPRRRTTEVASPPNAEQAAPPFGFQPLRDALLVRLHDGDTGPDIAICRDWREPWMGTVVAVGPGRRLDNGSVRAPTVAVGDVVVLKHVAYRRYDGEKILIGGEPHIHAYESDVLFVVGRAGL